ncbi:hypothetical protein GCM10012275_34170 [Longimycelium tulufanense]|uniref:Uncharacterized protein n=1 Tax=Longimycelium tulufanense TaxID=907463 RepID=A0A8J3FV36_9PSEU|nr:hypothetical protein [Longimycelium tulufanense]GGM60195.1 hypothetical protein GCM10012275_34170 [Longimycelium tulufanense]
MAHRHLERRPLGLVSSMVTALRTGDADGLADGLVALARADRTAPGRSLRACSAMVLRGCGIMLLTLAAANRGDAVHVRVRAPDGTAIRPRQAPPMLRHLFRALVAESEGNREAADNALDAAFLAAPPQERTAVLLTLLEWAVELVESCERHGLPRPRWLVDSPTGRHHKPDGLVPV